MALIGNFTMSSYTWPGPDAVPFQRSCVHQSFCRCHLSRSQNSPSHSKSDFQSLGIVADVMSCHPNSIGSYRIHSDSFPFWNLQRFSCFRSAVFSGELKQSQRGVMQLLEAVTRREADFSEI